MTAQAAHVVTTGKATAPGGYSYQHTARCSCGWDTVNAMAAGLDLEIREHINPGSTHGGTRPRDRKKGREDPRGSTAPTPTRGPSPA